MSLKLVTLEEKGFLIEIGKYVRYLYFNFNK